MTLLRGLALLSLLAACAGAQADCPATMPLKGVIKLDNCYPMRKDCVPAAEALYDYTTAMPDAGDEVLRISLHGSPWHLYGPDSRIMTIDDLAAVVRQQGSKIRQVILMSSWSGTAPDKETRAAGATALDCPGQHEGKRPGWFPLVRQEG